MKAHRVLIKIGTRALMNRRGGFDRRVLQWVASDLAGMKRGDRQAVLVSSGAILAGRLRLNLVDRELSMPQKQAAAAVGQNILMAEWVRAFNRHDVVVGQVLVTAEDLCERTRYLNARATLEELLRLGVVPVINENDTVAVEEIRYGDNDHLATLVAAMMHADLLIILTDTDGLFAQDPALVPGQKAIPVVRECDQELFAHAGPSHSGVGSGGMASKIEAARTVARRGVPTVIANAKISSIILQIMCGGEIGTLFVPEGPRLPERKYWMAFAGESRGKVVVDDGARKALEERGGSLLPSGVVEVEGDFQKGDLVSVVTLRGREIARGLVNYSAADVAKIKGHQCAEIETILGQKLYDEVIHRDYLVLTPPRPG